MYVYPLKSAKIPGDLKSPLGDLKSPLGDFRSPGKLEIQLRGRSLGQGSGKAQALFFEKANIVVKVNHESKKNCEVG